MSVSFQELMAKRKELEAQTKELERQIQQAQREEKQKVVAKIRELMTQSGLTVEDLKLGSVAKTPGASAGRTVAPKYRNDATGDTWTGRGLQPKWLKQAIAEGKTIESFAIQN